MPRLIIRFDVDTVECMRTGLSWLYKVGKAESVRFTFFANMGRSVDFAAVGKRMVNRWRSSNTGRSVAKAASLSPRKKLGLASYLETVFVNPQIGSVASDNLVRLLDEGHDVELHGGGNHSSWQHTAHTWDRGHLEREVDCAIDLMKQCGLPSPRMFASPGFTSPAGLIEVLRQRDFKVLADLHRSHEPIYVSETDSAGSIKLVNTGMLGEPGGVGFFENLYATGVTADQLPSLIESYYVLHKDFMCYDHPAFVVKFGREMLVNTIRQWRQLGGEIVSLSEIVSEFT